MFPITLVISYKQIFSLEEKFKAATTTKCILINFRDFLLDTALVIQIIIRVKNAALFLH